MREENNIFSVEKLLPGRKYQVLTRLGAKLTAETLPLPTEVVAETVLKNEEENQSVPNFAVISLLTAAVLASASGTAF